MPSLADKICEAGVTTLAELICEPCEGGGSGETVFIPIDQFSVNIGIEHFEADLDIIAITADIGIETYDANLTEDIYSADITMENYDVNKNSC